MNDGTAELQGLGLHVGYHGRSVINDLHLQVDSGTLTALVGPNGSGKSTLLMTLARVLAPRRGEVWLQGTPIRSMKSTAVARALAVLPQTAVAPTGLRVRELIEQGRFPRLSTLARLSRTDDDAMHRAMVLAGVESLADRRVDSLSGGERQRAWIAMVLAQDADILLLDEPTTYLDIRHQIDLMELLVGLVRDHGKTVVVVLHDLNQAARYCDRIIALRDGEIIADGAPATVVTEDLMRSVFDVRARITSDPVAGRPMFTAE